VTLDGKVLASKSVQFMPEKGTDGTGAGGITSADGNYTLISVRPGATKDTPGVPPGKYAVVITEPLFPQGTAGLPVGDSETPVPAIGIPMAKPRSKSGIPPIYGNAASTPLKIEVTSQGGVIDLKLVSK